MRGRCCSILLAGTLAAALAPPAPAQQSGDPYDPYRVQPAQGYPATSYSASAAAQAPGAQGDGQNLGNLLIQLQQLQQEVMMLRGKVEEQAFEIERLKEQQQELYVDLDRRIESLGGAAARVAAPTGAAPATAGAAAAATAVPLPPPRTGEVPEQPGEGEAYRAAYALVRGQQWDAAIKAFDQFLRDYPDGRYAPNAHYWLGELYLVVSPPQLEQARQAFMLLLTQYPEDNKVPDAMYKLGKVYYQKGNREKGREYLDRVIAEYGASNSSAVSLAREFIEQNY